MKKEENQKKINKMDEIKYYVKQRNSGSQYKVNMFSVYSIKTDRYVFSLPENSLCIKVKDMVELKDDYNYEVAIFNNQKIMLILRKPYIDYKSTYSLIIGTKHTNYCGGYNSGKYVTIGYSL